MVSIVAGLLLLVINYLNEPTLNRVTKKIGSCFEYFEKGIVMKFSNKKFNKANQFLDMCQWLSIIVAKNMFANAHYFIWDNF